MPSDLPTSAEGGYDVAVVGYGPVGALLALLLGRYGLRVLVLERDAAPHALPRAVHLDDEALRILQAAGVHEEVYAAARPLDGMDMVDAQRRLLVRARKRPLASRPFADRRPTATGYLLHQPVLEGLLRARVEALPNVEVRLGHAVEAVGPGADGVALRGSGPDGPFATRAAWVVGCDGARSRVRGAMESRLLGIRLEERWLVVDALLDDAGGLPERLIQVADPRRPTTFVPLPGRRKRWEFKLRPDEQPVVMTEEKTVRGLLAPWVGPAAVEVERAAVYTFHALTAERWRRGRLLLAGDAAHQMPPFLGQGLCAGLRDAHALAWRLALVARGTAGAALLDGYERERRAHVRAVTRRAVWAGRLIGLAGGTARLRDSFFALARRLAPLRRQLDALEADLLPIRAFTVGARVRHLQLVPQPLVRTSDGLQPLDDVLGDGFAVLTLDPGARAWADDGAWTGLPVRFVHVSSGGKSAGPTADVVVDKSGVLRRWAGAAVAAIVVRPDRHAFGRYRADEAGRAATDLRRALHP